jgi:hypothetical protein
MAMLAVTCAYLVACVCHAPLASDFRGVDQAPLIQVMLNQSRMYYESTIFSGVAYQTNGGLVFIYAMLRLRTSA